MVTSTFEYFAPASIYEATSLLAKYRDEAKILAGGHSLLPAMKLRLAEPKYLIDLGWIKELSYIREQDGYLAIGAMTSYYDLESSDLVKRYAPVLSEAASNVADLQIRNAGTIGGSLSHADPAGDLPAVALALGAQLVVNTRRSSRIVNIDRFFVDMMTTVLKPTELLTEIRVPFLSKGTGSSYQKFFNKASHYAIVGVAAIVTVSNGICINARIAITGAGPKAVRARRVERILKGKKLDKSVVKRASKRASAGIELLGDIHASDDYRAHLTNVYAERAINEAMIRAV